MEREIKIAAMLYECRDTAKRLFKKDFITKVEPYVNSIKKVMNEAKVDCLKAVLIISKMESFQNDGMIQMMFFAAAVEIIEPSI